MTKLKRLTLSAMLLALATVLMLASKLLPALPWGGSVTLASSVPIMAISLLLGNRQGLMAGAAFALIQMITGFYPPPTQTILSFFAVILLDYLLAFGVLGLAGLFDKLYQKKKYAILLSAATVTILRYLCHILSGILIWRCYAPEGQGVFLYSLFYNGSYMIPEIVINTAVSALFTPLFRHLSFVINRA